MIPDELEELLETALLRLRAGELMVVPTETVYGLAADASNATAIAKIFALKRRPASRPLIVHLAGAEALDRWAREVPGYACMLAARFWPGPLTLVLRRGALVPDIVTAGQDTVALRVPAHPLTLELLRRFGGGLAAPSANRYGRISPTAPEHVRAQFGAETPLILDGGPCQVGIESTILACLDEQPRILRPGMVTARELAEALGRPVEVRAEAEEGLRSPGQDLSHYAPTTPARLLPRTDLAAWRAEHPGRCGFLGFAAPGFEVDLDLRLPDDPAAAARELYAALHALDAAGLDVLLIEEPPAMAAWEAVSDRLGRACARG
jgi:L-threonylcarbamoyladenylate synthase